MSEAKRDLIGLDVLRIIAATLIVFHHYQQVYEVRFSTINFFAGGYPFGFLVELFFIISGFLTIYSAKAQRSIGKRLFKKLLRFVPMATIACVITLIAKLITDNDIQTLLNWKTLVANFFLLFSGWPFFEMTGINNPTWYLCILIQCYILHYLIEWIRKKTGVSQIWFDITVFVLIILVHKWHFVFESTYRGVEAFFIGLIIYEMKNYIPKNIFASICLMVILILSVIATLRIESQQRLIMAFITFPSVILLCVQWKGFGNAIFQKTIKRLGMMSFEVYIWHYPLMAIEKAICKMGDLSINHTFIVMILFTIICWIIAYPLFMFVETPINSIIRKRFL